MTFGEEGTSGARVTNGKFSHCLHIEVVSPSLSPLTTALISFFFIRKVPACEAMLDIFQAHGHNELDTALSYCAGTSEKFLGRMDLKKRGLIVDSKLYPTKPDSEHPFGC